MGKLSSIESEFASTEDEATYQLWFAAKVNASLADTRPAASHASVMAKLDEIIDRAEKMTPAS